MKKTLKRAAGMLLAAAFVLASTACTNPAGGDGTDEPKVPPETIDVYWLTSYVSSTHTYYYRWRSVPVYATATTNSYSKYTIAITGLTPGSDYAVAGERIGSTPESMTDNWKIFTSGTTGAITDSGLVQTADASGKATFVFYGANPYTWGSALNAAQFKIVYVDTTVDGGDSPWVPVLAGAWSDEETLTNFCIPYAKGYDIELDFFVNYN